ncbi:HD domain-containing protein [Phormidium yuhuli AB48]|uniref:HD domain-containing protein n=1 Tax=Phormidium yuhuli AB48 TaxID=2940671 RepID=A0ABY5AMC3_9CYAN|nr:HD domain-containing protein [Phormidium yuhuli]USR90083.1 HD domain-containing protein [Phormidium yuhuli AB48]
MVLSQRFTEALLWATELHQQQVRKGSGVPYIAHLLGVTSEALEYGATEDEAIAALLHDAIEDCGGRPIALEIRRRFGDNVAEIVEGCTDAVTQPKPPWRERKQAYISHLRTASPSVRLVSAADKLYNARSILKDCRCVGDEIWQRFTGGRAGSLWYYRAVVDTLKSVDNRPIVAELERVVQELERLAASIPQSQDGPTPHPSP